MPWPATRKPTDAARGTVNLRVEAATRDLIDSAASALGKTRTEFMVDAARRRAVDVLLDQRLFALAPDAQAAFFGALDDAPPPGPKLRSLLRRTPAWEGGGWRRAAPSRAPGPADRSPRSAYRDRSKG